MLGSHNTMSYLSPNKWWMYPFIWLAKCQSKDFLLQKESKVNYFDLRIKIKNDIIYFAHGLMTYQPTSVKTLKYIYKYTLGRLILECGDKEKFYSIVSELKGLKLHYAVDDKKSWNIFWINPKYKNLKVKDEYFRFSWKEIIPIPILYKRKYKKLKEEDINSSNIVVLKDFI